MGWHARDNPSPSPRLTDYLDGKGKLELRLRLRHVVDAKLHNEALDVQHHLPSVDRQSAPFLLLAPLPVERPKRLLHGLPVDLGILQRGPQ